MKEVSKEFFNPIPKIDSLFVRFSPKKKEVNQKELQNLKKVTRALFNKKRKKISNSLEDIHSDDIIISKLPSPPTGKTLRRVDVIVRIS